MDFNSLFRFYKNHLEQEMLPFWNRALDHRSGGIYTCFNNTGDKLISRDKYTWSQGRYLWLWSKISEMISENKLDGPIGLYKSHLHKTASFLEDHIFLENGNCAFVLTETGNKKESIPGKGYDSSIFADCFVVIGFAGYAAFFGDDKRFNKALELYKNIKKRLDTGKFRSEPYPVPEGYRSHAIPMIMLNVTQELSRAAERIGHQEYSILNRYCVSYMEEIIEKHCLQNHRVVEMLPDDPAGCNTLFYRHINPGHAIESMWFVIQTAQKTGRPEYIQKAVNVIKKAIESGWDSEYGGLLRFADTDGGKPKGRQISSPMEQMILNTWDMKLWWPHSEALYALLLVYHLTGDNDINRLHKKVHNYTFSTFPNPDKSAGEWIQIRNRQGNPVDQFAALPVKDPFHIIRNLILILDLAEPSGGN
jgi:N-acylglucosamine 2-epimerase